MKKYFLAFAASSMIFTSVISCKDAGEQEAVEMEEVYEVDEMQENAIDPDTKELENTDMVPSGTYTGEAIIVDSEQQEVYVRLNDTTTIELYFSNETQIMRNGEQVQFDALQEGQTVEVEVERSGESLKPLTVRIMENQ